jgi:hypothetical protein
MKTVSAIIFTIFLLPTLTFSQKIMTDKVPASVTQAFMKEYPKAMESGWRMVNENYQVMFTLDGVKHAAKFDKSGQWVDKEERINLANLPKEITAAISKNFVGFKAYEAEKVETPSKGILYNVGLEKEKEFKEVHFSKTGEILEQMAKKTKSEWGKDND